MEISIKIHYISTLLAKLNDTIMSVSKMKKLYYNLNGGE